MDDFEKLINASDLVEWIMETYPDWCVGDVRSIVDHVIDLPSAQPDDAALHESCTDCPLYDHNRHRCPRFNKVIPTTIQEIMDTQTQRGKWVKISPANIYECSKCGKNVMTDDISEYYFCHGCGADMREVRE